LNRKQEAIAEFQKVLEYSPGFLTAMFNLGVVNEQLGNREAAREWYTRVIETSPTSALGRSAGEHLSALGGGG
jgi:tetratricopeptide (TPR) repeat protein